MNFVPSSSNITTSSKAFTTYSSQPCSRLQSCAETTQGAPVAFEILDFVDYLRPQPPTVTYTVGIDGQPQTARKGGAQGQYLVEFSRDKVGTYVLAVSVDNQPIEQSPFFVEVRPGICEKMHEEANSDGECECVSGYIRVRKSCRSTGSVVLAIVLPICLVLLLLIALYIRRQRHLADRQWRVPYKDLEFPVEPKVLGRGEFGEVLLAKLRGNDVVVKRSISMVAPDCKRTPFKHHPSKTQADLIAAIVDAPFTPAADLSASAEAAGNMDGAASGVTTLTRKPSKYHMAVVAADAQNSGARCVAGVRGMVFGNR